MVEALSRGEVKFNQAAYQQERINALMTVINVCRINLTKFNPTFSDYNYRVVFRTLTSYYTEIRVKLSNTEKEPIDKIMKKLEEYMENNSILIPTRRSTLYGSGSTGMRFNEEAWKVINQNLFIYQNKILDAAEAKGFGNPTKKDPTKAVIDM